MVDKAYTHIQVSWSNKEKLDNLKLFERETINSIVGELIEFGEKHSFKDIRFENLTKKLGNKDNAKNKSKQGAISQIG